MRWSRAGLDAELRALATAAVGVEAAPANVSTVLGERAGRTRTKHQLHVQGDLTTVTGADGTLVRAVIRALGALAVGAPEGTLTLKALLVLSAGGTATIVDRRLATGLRSLEPGLRRAGARITAVPHVLIRPATGEAVLPDGAGALGVSVAEVDTRWPRQRGDDDLVAGPVPVDRLVYAGRPDPESTAAAVADMAPMLRDGTGRLRTDDVAALTAFAGAVEHEVAATADRTRLRRALGLG